MKFLKITGIVIIVLGLVAYAFSDYFIERKLKEELSEIINTDSLNYYTFSLEKLDLSIVTGSITIKGVKITPTQEALNKLQNSSNNIRVLVSFSCDNIKMKGFEINHFLKTRELIIDKFIVEKPSFEYLFNKNKKSNSKTLGLNNLFSDSFKKAELKQFIIDNAQISIKNIHNNLPLMRVEKFNFKLTDAVVDASTIEQFSPFNYSNIEFSADSLRLKVSKDFEISTGQLIFNANRNATIINNFRLKPAYGQKQFSKTHSVQKQWVAIGLDTFKIIDIDFEELVQHGVFNLNKVTLVNANVGLFKDKSKPEPPFKKQLLPASALRNLKIDLSIDTIEVKRSRIVINEKSKKTGQVSYLSFEDLNAQVYGFTNDSISLALNKYLFIYAQTKVMNSAQVNFKATFDLLSKNDSHTIKANVGSSKMDVFNKVLEPMMSVVVKSGEIISLNYQYTANDTEANGTIDFEYENVKLEVLSEGEEAKKQGFLSLAANTVIKSNNNKEYPKNYTQGIIKVQRVQNKNVFPYLWHAVQTGIIYTMAPAFSEIKKEEKKANKKGWFKKK
ncbi:MAG: hypothetical protein L3J29_03000 [Cyclobacteriaceae bacterium]|nr:hypothetical protein [Cyclobacteriaceae bacterium]